MDGLDLATKEKFAFGKREEVIASLIPGTEQHRHASILNNLHLNTNDSLQAAKAALSAYRSANASVGGEMLTLENRFALIINAS